MQRKKQVSWWLCVILAGLFSGSYGALILGCGNKNKETEATPATTALTASFAKTCATCHGSDGATDPDGARKGHGVLLSTSLSAKKFKEITRDGFGSIMLAYGKAVMSDADIETNYTILTAE